MGFTLGEAPHGYPQSQTLSPQVPQKATVGLGCSRRPTEDRPIGSPGTLSTPGPMGLCIRSVGRKGRDLGHYCGRLGREMLEVRQRQRWRSEGIGIQRLRVDPAVSALDEASGLMKPEPEVRTSFHPGKTKPRRFSNLGAPPFQDGCALLLRLTRLRGVPLRAPFTHRLVRTAYPSAAWKASRASPGVS